MSKKSRAERQQGKLTKLSGSWSLFKAATADFRAHLKLYVGIVSLVTIPANVLMTYFGEATGTTLQAYLSLAGLFMNVALIYAVVRHHREGDRFGLRTAYYSGSHAVLRFVVVTVLLGAMLLPLAVGSEIYGAGVTPGSPAAPGELILLALVGLPFVLVSLWLLTRNVLSLIVVVDREVRPVSAIRLSWQLTRRRFWPVLGRLIMLGLWLLLVLLVPLVVLVGLYVLTRNVFFLMLLQIAVSVIGLPLGIIYGFHLYDELQTLTEV